MNLFFSHKTNLHVQWFQWSLLYIPNLYILNISILIKLEGRNIAKWNAYNTHVLNLFFTKPTFMYSGFIYAGIWANMHYICLHKSVIFQFLNGHKMSFFFSVWPQRHNKSTYTCTELAWQKKKKKKFFVL